MEENIYSGLFDFVMYFIEPFSGVLDDKAYYMLVSSSAQIIFTLFISAILSAMFGAFGYLIGTKRGGKRG